MNNKKIKNNLGKKGIMLATGLMLFVSSPGLTMAATTNVNFPESSLINQTKTITLPSNFDSVTSLLVDNGVVSYSVNGNQMNITVNNGSPVSSDNIYNPQKYNKPATTFLYSRTNDLPLTAIYTDEDGYSGTLDKEGSDYVASGSLIPGESKTVTDKQVSPDPNYFPNVLDYNYGGFTGTLNKNGTPVKTKIDGDSFIQDKKTATDSVEKTGSISNPSKFKFDGQTYVQLPNALMNFGSGTNSVTVEGWYYIDTNSSVSLFGKNGDLPNENQFMFGIYNNNFDIATSNNTYRSTYNPIRYQKVHLAMVINGTQATVYENGINKWSTTVNSRTLSSERAPKLGMDLDGGIVNPSDFFKGYMYEVRLYERALSQTEVNNNKNGTVTRTNLAAEYLFNAGSGTTISDSSGKGNHATVIGNANWEGTPTAPTFSNTLSYDDGSYAGTLNKNGGPIISSQTGTYTPTSTQLIADVRTSTTNSFPETISYNSGGYVGTLYKDGSATSTTTEETISKTGTYSSLLPMYEQYRYNGGSSWTYLGTTGQTYPTSYSYNDGTYSGTIPFKSRSTAYVIDKGCYMDGDQVCSATYLVGGIFDRKITQTFLNYEGTVYGKKNVTTYTQKYQGTVTKVGSDTRVVKYVQNYSGDIVRYITPTTTVGSMENNFANSIEYTDRSGFKGTIYKSGAATQASDGQYIQKYTGRVYSQTFDSSSYEYVQYYTGTASSGGIDTRIWKANYSGTAYKGEYEPANEKYRYNVTVNYSVFSGGATCSYKNISPPSTTVSNYVPKCISVTKPNNDLYKMLYNFGVTGISVAGDR